MFKRSVIIFSSSTYSLHEIIHMERVWFGFTDGCCDTKDIWGCKCTGSTPGCLGDWALGIFTSSVGNAGPYFFPYSLSLFFCSNLPSTCCTEIGHSITKVQCFGPVLIWDTISLCRFRSVIVSSWMLANVMVWFPLTLKLSQKCK